MTFGGKHYNIFRYVYTHRLQIQYTLCGFYSLVGCSYFLLLDFIQIKLFDVEWINVAQDKDQWQVLVGMIMNFWVM
jgi:hypothetical protein